ncbi:MAG TPA: DUF4954 family protein [Chitinispirillaceae bacterium]|jgi:hypothetical protein|nr:DUF4954 family protein [Chitinispirillaceae bacterium]
MKNRIMDTIVSDWQNSEHIRTLQSLKSRKGSRLFGDRVRSLTPEEIKVLVSQGNRASDWNEIRVSDGFIPENIYDNLFRGACVLGVFTGKEVMAYEGAPFSSGIYKSVICNSEIGNDCLLFRAGLISNCVIMDGAAVYETGSLLCSGKSAFGNGRSISVGIETGGREVKGFAELTIQTASAVALNRKDSAQLALYDDFVEAYTEECSVPFGVVEQNAVIRNTSKVEDCFIGKSCVIDGATLVQNSTILSSPEEPVQISHGAFVRNSILQWGSEVTSMGIVDDSVLTEHSHVERHGKVTSSIIGPNTGIAEGEVTSCLLGPFVGFHHQALLIAAIWPEGKGNVAYGANVGSNHTSKSPDQEIWCGEGLFFGLGVNIKFPCDLTRAPYSLIATSVNTLPQRIEFPFSLINTPSFHPPNLPPLHNEIFPGWVLYNNIYTVMRNESKYLKRNKARRNMFTYEVFRPDIADLMVLARDALVNISETRELYTGKEIKGLGKNFLTEENRLKAIESYNFYIEYYCLVSLLEAASDCVLRGDTGSIGEIATLPGNPRWEHARGILISGGYPERTVKESLERLIEMKEKIASDTERSKFRDDQRGSRIIDDYACAHERACDDSFVKEMWAKVSESKAQIEKILAALQNITG